MLCWTDRSVSDRRDGDFLVDLGGSSPLMSLRLIKGFIPRWRLQSDERSDWRLDSRDNWLIMGRPLLAPPHLPFLSLPLFPHHALAVTERASTVLLRGFLMAPHDDTPAMLLCRFFVFVFSCFNFQNLFLSCLYSNHRGCFVTCQAVGHLYVDMFVTLPLGNVENYMHTKNI